MISAMEAGLITTQNSSLAHQLRQMRDYGKSPDGEDIVWLGLSARVPEINAIVAYHNFAHVDELVERRQGIMSFYREQLAGLAGVTFQEIPTDRQTSGNYFAIFIDPQKSRRSRDEVYQRLQKDQIQAKKYFYPALHLQKVYQELGHAYRGRLPITEQAAKAGLALPMFSHMTEKMLVKVVDAVKIELQ